MSYIQFNKTTDNYSITTGRIINPFNKELTLESSNKMNIIANNISVNGNVGIGTTSPTEKLEVNGSIKATGSITTTSGNIETPGSVISGVTKLSTNGTIAMFSHVSNNSLHNAAIYQLLNGNTIVNANPGNNIFFNLGSGTNTNTKMIIMGGEGAQHGYVGIGKGDNPILDELLHVGGNIKADNSIIAQNGNIIVSIGADTASFFGKAIVGNIGHVDHAGFGHIDSVYNNTTGYALMQSSVGNTFINAGNNGTINFGINHSNKMILLANGNFGIGNNNPTEKLEVTGNIKIDHNIIAQNDIISQNGWVVSENGSMLASRGADTTSYFGKAVIGNVGHTDYAGFGHLDSTQNNTGYALMQYSDGNTFINAGNNGNINFGINHNSKMTLLNNGNLGIGTNNPIEKLEVIGNIKIDHNVISQNDIISQNGWVVSENGSMLASRGADTASYFGKAVIGNVGHTDYAGFGHLDSIQNNTGYALMQYSNGNTFLNAGYNGSIDFLINNDAKMHLLNNGNLGIGAPGDEKLHVGGTIIADGDIYVGVVNAISINTHSDDRLKHNEEDLSNCLSVIRKLKPQKYQKTVEIKAADFNGPLEENEYSTEAGFIAQDIINIPELAYSVTRGDYTQQVVDSSGAITETIIERPFNLNYNNILTYNVAATKELDTKLDTTVAELLAEIASLKQRLSLLEN